MIDFFALPVNGGKPVKNFASLNLEKPIVQKVIVQTNNTSAATTASTMPPTTPAPEVKVHEEVSAGGCGCGGSCSCGKGSEGGNEGSCGCGGGCSC